MAHFGAPFFSAVYGVRIIRGIDGRYGKPEPPGDRQLAASHLERAGSDVEGKHAVARQHRNIADPCVMPAVLRIRTIKSALFIAIPEK